MTAIKIILLLLIILVIFELVVIYLLARYIGDFVTKIESIRGIKVGSLLIGDQAPQFREFDDKGNKILSSHLYSQGTTLLLFVSSTCPTCKGIVGNFEQIESRYALNFVIINNDEQLDDTAITNKVSDQIIYIRSNKLSQAFSINTVPYAILVNQQGEVISLNEIKHIRSLTNMLINEKVFVS